MDRRTTLNTFGNSFGCCAAGVRKNSLMVLTHLIMNDMMKVKGHIARMALCLQDPHPRIKDLAHLFFHELAQKNYKVAHATTTASLLFLVVPFASAFVVPHSVVPHRDASMPFANAFCLFLACLPVTHACIAHIHCAYFAGRTSDRASINQGASHWCWQSCCLVPIFCCIEAKPVPA